MPKNHPGSLGLVTFSFPLKAARKNGHVGESEERKKSITASNSWERVGDYGSWDPLEPRKVRTLMAGSILQKPRATWTEQPAARSPQSPCRCQPRQRKPRQTRATKTQATPIPCPVTCSLLGIRRRRMYRNDSLDWGTRCLLCFTFYILCARARAIYRSCPPFSSSLRVSETRSGSFPSSSSSSST